MGQQLADFLFEHIERGAPVDRCDHVALGFGDAARGADQRAALGQADRDRYLGCEQHPRQPGLSDPLGDLMEGSARGGQPADQETGTSCCRLRHDFHHGLVARIAVHDSEQALMLRQPFGLLFREGLDCISTCPVGDRRHDPECRLGQRGGQDRQRGAVVVFDSGCGDPEADVADPMLDAGALAQEC